MEKEAHQNQPPSIRANIKTKELPTLELINGVGASLEDIAHQYIDRIEGGYDLTVAEMANYLRCSEMYIWRRLQEHIRHIVIDSKVGRKALIRHGYNILGGEKPHVAALFTNRKLYCRADFIKYILTNGEKVITYERYDLDDLAAEVKEELFHKVGGDTDQAKMVFKHLVKASPKWESPQVEKASPLTRVPYFENKLTAEESVDSRLYSVADLVKEGIDGRVFLTTRYVYHFLVKTAVPKIRIGNLIRYDKADIRQSMRPENWPIITLPVKYKKEWIMGWVEREVLNNGATFNDILEGKRF